MKLALFLAQVLLCTSVCSAQKIQPSFIAESHATAESRNAANGDDWLQKATAHLDKATYHFKNTGKEYAVLNTSQHLVFGMSANKLIINPVEKSASWSTTFDLISVGKKRAATQAALYTNENYLKFITTDYDVEYINNEAGLRQNFIIKNKPSGSDALQVNMKVSGSLKPSVLDENVLQLLHVPSGKVYIKYDGLKVWDANHKSLNASMKLSKDNELVINVDDEMAVYPVTIDPLTHAAEWTVSANGILPGLLTNLQLQVDALVGYSMAGIGDVNGDGFDDVAIGAPGAIDVIAGPATLVGAGAVFVYLGSANGLPATPSRTLRAITPVANALFGFSIAGGNCIGDSKSDIVVGAPGESYSTTVSGLPNIATVTAGKVYAFRGQDLASGFSSAFASVYLNGTNFFSNGVLGVLLSNVNVNALFGFSVAITGDMSNDGLGEIIVGAPGYAGVQLLDVRSGAAFVYNSQNISTNAPAKLNAPSLLDFPLLSDINGLLFGFSVDGAGDYNKDSKQDVIVGAPGGLSISVNNLLGGSAYIFPGKADNSGVSPTIQAQLTAGGALLGPVANLFGYNVKGAKDASGARTGNVLVSAPSGNVLSNVLAGLRLKAGNIHVFNRNAAGGTHSPKQSFTSPRSTSLLSILSLQPINLSVLFGTAMDNMRDVNCDGFGDIIVGEPLSTGVGLIGANAVGGAAYIFLGKADSTYTAAPYWTLENTVSQGLGINAASMIGYSVAGAGYTYGNVRGVRAIVGAPGKALDFSSGILALGNTLGTLFDFAAGDNGLGKSYAYGFDCDRYAFYPDVNVTLVNVLVPGNVNTNDVVPAGSTYSTPVPSGSNPGGATIVMNSNGTYTFVSTTPGVYSYQVPSCAPNKGCQDVTLTITVVNNNSLQKPPVANTDIAITKTNTAVTIFTVANDAAGSPGRSIVPSSVTITSGPKYGTAVVDPATGNIIYTPMFLYTGMDTLSYTVKDDAEPTQGQASAIQMIRIDGVGAINNTLAADDYVLTAANQPATGNVKTNDTDAEGNTQTVTAQNITVAGKGQLVLNADGSYVFTPEPGFTGPVSFSYITCDDGTPAACAGATLYILVLANVNPDLTPSTRISNGTFIEPVSTSRNFVIEVNEIYGNAIDNASVPVRVRVFKSDNFSYTFEPTETTAAVPSTITVNNPDWTLVQNTATVMVFELKQAANIIPYNNSKINIKMQVLPGAAEGTETVTVSILNGSGAEVNYTNNSIVRILNIVH
ncbi:MAG: hypothetical protein EOP51_06085 [Sphingobacteriales bacterium]|nr:MAG: hypothetical protein EOP51_06085 [Sphingobacteriales bacterium]